MRLQHHEVILQWSDQFLRLHAAEMIMQKLRSRRGSYMKLTLSVLHEFIERENDVLQGIF